MNIVFLAFGCIVLLSCVCSNEFKHFQKMTMTPSVEGKLKPQPP